MNRLQKTIIRAAQENEGVLPAPTYTLTMDEAQAYCGLHNYGLIKLGRDWSLMLTSSGLSWGDDSED